MHLKCCCFDVLSSAVPTLLQLGGIPTLLQLGGILSAATSITEGFAESARAMSEGGQVNSEGERASQSCVLYVARCRLCLACSLLLGLGKIHGERCIVRGLRRATPSHLIRSAGLTLL